MVICEKYFRDTIALQNTCAPAEGNHVTEGMPNKPPSADVNPHIFKYIRKYIQYTVQEQYNSMIPQNLSMRHLKYR